METLLFKIPSIHCEHCIHTIKMELEDMEGVTSVQANLSTKEVEVDYSEPANKQRIVKLLQEINYPPEDE